MLEIQLEMIEEKPIISSVVGRNKQANRTAFMAVPALILFMPFAIGFAWYGVAFAGPSLFVIPAANTVPASCNLTIYIFWHGHWPDFDGWLQIFLGAGLNYAFALLLTGILVKLGVVGMSVLMSLLTASGVGIVVAASILAA